MIPEFYDGTHMVGEDLTVKSWSLTSTWVLLGTDLCTVYSNTDFCALSYSYSQDTGIVMNTE